VGELRGAQLSTVKKTMDPAIPFLPGAAAETGRAFWWRSGDETGDPLSATEILRRMGLPLERELIDAAES
jgi:hypothetical protein